jgi:hypothetical protein
LLGDSAVCPVGKIRLGWPLWLKGNPGTAGALEPDDPDPALEPAIQVAAAPMLGDERDEGGEDVRHGPA